MLSCREPRIVSTETDENNPITFSSATIPPPFFRTFDSFDTYMSESTQSMTPSVDNAPKPPSQRRAPSIFQPTCPSPARGATHVRPRPQELYGQVYWTREELADIRSAKQADARQIKSQHSHVSSSILSLHGIVGRARPEEQRHYEEATAALDEPLAPQTLSQCNCRGLEPTLTSAPARKRGIILEKILQVQEACREDDPDQREQKLRQWSVRLSKSSCDFAQKMALLDTQWATEDAIEEGLALEDGRINQWKKF